MRIWACIAVPFAVTSACASSTPVEAPAADPMVRVGRLFPKPDSLEASRIAVTLEVQNPRGAPIEVTGIDYAIDTQDVSGVLSGHVDGGATLEAEQMAEIEFTVGVPFPTEKARFLEILDRGTLPLVVRGTVTFADGSTVDFARNGAVATPTFPGFVVHDAQAARYGQEGVDVTLFLRLVNENPFAVTIGDVAYTVTIEGTKAKSEQGAIGVRLTQGAAQEFEVSVPLDASTFENLNEILKSGTVRYQVTGRVSIGEYERPFDHDGEIQLAGGS